MRKLYKICNGKLIPAMEGELHIGIEPIYGEPIFKQDYAKYMEYRRDKLCQELNVPKELLGPQTTNNPTRNKP